MNRIAAEAYILSLIESCPMFLSFAFLGCLVPTLCVLIADV